MNNIKHYKQLIENAENKYYYVGNCVDSFDEDTMEYCHGQLLSIEDLGIIDETDIEEALNDKSKNLIDYADKLLNYVPSLDDNSVLIYNKKNDVYVLYNPEEDIHYFYEP
ncbi:hypothetical protein PBI_SCTP2_441 [Salicola phage SCTP-2]|nr:hypothetical protein PBI_SCTP2_441 [Salicola phage SCTP-2]